MMLRFAWCGVVVLVCLTACRKPVPQVTQAASTPPQGRETQDGSIHATGTVQAVRFVSVPVPQLMGQGGRITLTRIVPGGTRVKEGDVLAEFDRTQQLDNARDAEARFQDLAFQADQRAAQNRADAARRAADLARAQADLSKAEIQIRKGPLLSEIDRLKAEVRMEDARARVESLKKSGAARVRGEQAAVRLLELQRDRWKMLLQRAQRNVERLQLKAPLAGMVALENVWRNGTMGHAQEGDQLWSGQPLVRIFDPSEMKVRTRVGEPDGGALVPGCRARVRLDAYPGTVFSARLETASPVAAADLGSPIKTFTATFRLETTDARLLPDLSAVVLIEPASGGAR